MLRSYLPMPPGGRFPATFRGPILEMSFPAGCVAAGPRRQLWITGRALSGVGRTVPTRCQRPPMGGTKGTSELTEVLQMRVRATVLRAVDGGAAGLASARWCWWWSPAPFRLPAAWALVGVAGRADHWPARRDRGGGRVPPAGRRPDPDRCGVVSAGAGCCACLPGRSGAAAGRAADAPPRCRAARSPRSGIGGCWSREGSAGRAAGHGQRHAPRRRASATQRLSRAPA